MAPRSPSIGAGGALRLPGRQKPACGARAVESRSVGDSGVVETEGQALVKIDDRIWNEDRRR